MTEKDFYTRRLRPALHKPPDRVLLRVEDYGIPDVLLIQQGSTFYLELKALDHLPAREGTPIRVKTTVEQRRTMQQINGTSLVGDRAFVLLAVARQKLWFLLRADTPTELGMSDLPRWTVASGDFSDLNRIKTEVFDAN